MKKIIILGGGPGGYVAAIRAAQLGAEVHLVETDKLGGTCLNIGCIPTKAVLHTAELYQEVLTGAKIGLLADNIRVDWAVVMKRKQQVVRRLVGGVDGLLKANKVTVHKGKGTLVDPRTVAVSGAEMKKISGDAVIIATGSEPVKLKFPGADLPGVIDSTAALSLEKIPKSIVIIGGGVIGVEFAALFSAFGAKVTVVEMLPQILPPIDGEIAVQVRQELTKNGVQFLTEARLTEVVRQGEELCAKAEINGVMQELPGELVLVAVGRRPRTDGIGLEAVGIATDRGKIKVDANFITNVPGVYAIGDCNGIMMLAHAASAQGHAAAEHALRHEAVYTANTVPSCIYTSPEVSGVGMTEEQVQAKGMAYNVGRFPLAGNGKAMIECGGTGMVKIIAGAKYGEILGVHIFGPRATDMIAEAALAIRLEATVDELISTIHAHPTVSEAVGEAAMAVLGNAIHWPPDTKR